MHRIHNRQRRKGKDRPVRLEDARVQDKMYKDSSRMVAEIQRRIEIAEEFLRCMKIRQDTMRLIKDHASRPQSTGHSA
jgi:hypothetical protein